VPGAGDGSPGEGARCDWQAGARASTPPAGRAELATLDAVIRAHVEQVLTVCHGRIEGPHGAARALGVNPHTLRARMRQLDLDWARIRSG
jgi:transcriptional regulator with GAF, ATPase, and Fis domain